MKLKKDGFRRFRGGVSKKKKGETTKNFARRVKAVFALSGDYSMPNGYTCIRGGKIYQGGNVGAHAVYNANTGMLSGPDAITLNGRTARQVVASGDVYNSFNFGPAIVRDGNVLPKKAMNQRNGKGRPRAFIGTTGKAGDLYVVVTEGADSTGECRSDGKSYGLTGYQCAMVLKRLGCTFGVPIDGGGSVQMVYKGKAVNRMNRISFTQEGRPKTRKLYDFYYLSRTA